MSEDGSGHGVVATTTTTKTTTMTMTTTRPATINTTTYEATPFSVTTGVPYRHQTPVKPGKYCFLHVFELIPGLYP